MMIETPSIFADIATLRWPNASHIYGIGRFAILSRCPQKPFVRLFGTAIEAQPLLHEPCEHAFCKGAHFLFDLEQQPAPAAPFRKRAHWHRLIELPR